MSEQRKDMKKETKEEEKGRKKEKKKEEKRKKKEAAGWEGGERETRGRHRGGYGRDAGAGSGGRRVWGVLVVTLWLRGAAGHAWGLSHANHRNVLTSPWMQGALDSG